MGEGVSIDSWFASVSDFPRGSIVIALPFFSHCRSKHSLGPSGLVTSLLVPGIDHQLPWPPALSLRLLSWELVESGTSHHKE